MFTVSSIPNKSIKPFLLGITCILVVWATSFILSDRRTDSPPSMTSHVLISSYMRSGSTFLSSLLSYRDDVFFWYEPLMKKMPAWKYFQDKDMICYAHYPGCTPTSTKLFNQHFQVLVDIYNRSIARHVEKFDDIRSGHDHVEDYNKCRKDGFSMKTCYTGFARKCESAKHLVTKVLRLDILLFEPLLETFPELKILHLLRDPRGIINCRINTRWYPISNTKSIYSDAEVLCGRMRRDIEGAQILARKFPNRVRIIQYEDIVGMTEIPTAIYKYLGMDPSTTDGRMVELLEKSKNYRPDTYRTKMSQPTLETVQKQCADVIEMLGLRVFANYGEMANSSMSVVRNRLPYAF